MNLGLCILIKEYKLLIKWMNKDVGNRWVINVNVINDNVVDSKIYLMLYRWICMCFWIIYIYK